MSNADRQKRYRDGKRNAPVTENVTRVTVEGCNAPKRNAQADGIVIDDADRNAPKVTSEDAPQSTKSGEVVAEHPLPGGPGTKEYLMGMHPDDLQIRLKSYPGDTWVNSPEHKEVMRRRGPYRKGTGVGPTVAGAMA